MSSVKSAANSDVVEIDFTSISAKLVKHRQTMISTVVACLAIALVYSFTAKPMYKATSRLLTDAAPPKIVKVEGTVLPDYTDRTNYFNSQIEILKSRSVAELVMQDIGGYEPPGRRDKDPAKLKKITQEERIADLLKHVTIAPVRMTQVIEIQVEDTSPELAAHIANTWSRAYILFSSLDQFIQRRSELESDLVQQSKYLKDKHPIIIALRNEIETIDSKIKNERDRVMKDVVNGTPGNNGGITNVKILDRALVPLEPERPRKAMTLVVAVFIGIFLGFVLTFLFESLDQTIKTVDSIEALMGIPNLVPIPRYRKGAEKAPVKPEFISAQLRQSIIAEAFRSLRTSIIFSDPDLVKKTFIITSTSPSEGKTTVAINLATVFAQSDERVLLVDADLRKPRLHTAFNIERGQGITDILVYDKHDVGADIHKTDIPNLDVMTCGSLPPNPSELLGSKKMEALIQRLASMYDKVIFDTPPVLSATDAVILSTKVNASIFVVKAGTVHQQAVVRAVNIMKGVPGHILGAILNMADTREPGSYYYHYPQAQEKKPAKV